MDLGAPEIIVIGVVVLVLFGSKKLPDTARSVGRSLRIFKSEMREMKHDEPETPATTVTVPPAAVETVATQPVVGQPVTAQPVVDQPVVAEPAATPVAQSQRRAE